MGVDDFLRFSFLKLKNPDLSSIFSTINVTFVDDSTGSGSVVASKNTSFASAISGPPLNIQINSIATSSQKLLVSTAYTISMSTVDGSTLKINPQSHLGLIIVFPTEYKEIWHRVSTSPEVTLTLGSVVYTASAHLINGTMIVEYRTTAAVEFSQIVVSFNFVNPSRPLNCSLLPSFTVSIFDFTLNSIKAETLSNNIECPVFRNQLFAVNISGSSQMEAGSVYKFTISIEKPAKLL